MFNSSARQDYNLAGSASFAAKMEWRLVTTCTLRPVDLTAWRAEIIELARGVTDWSEVIALVQRHQVYGLVHGALSGVSEAARIPAEVVVSLAATARRSRLDALLRLGEARRVADAFQRAGVPVVQLKGTPLSERLYGDALLRHSMDIDVLVPPMLLSEAAQLLQRLGYSTDEELPLQPGLQSRLQRRAYHHCMYRSPANVPLELHWRLGTYSDALTQQFVAESLPSASTGLHTLPPATELAYLVAHGTNHYWARLKWLSDIKQALLYLGPATWSEFASECAAVGVQHSVEVTRHMLAAIFATPSAAMPESTQPQARHLRSASYALYRMRAPLEIGHGVRSMLERTRYRLDCAPAHHKLAVVLRCASQVHRLARHS